MTVTTILGGIFVVLAWAGVAYTLLAAGFVGRICRPTKTSCAAFTPITVLKPLHGDEPGLEQNLETFFRQAYPAPVQIVFGVQAQNDPAIKAVEHLCDRFPQADVSLVVSARVHGDNAKVSNLANMAGTARHPLIVLSDSDIAVAPDYLKRIAAAMADEAVGAATCLYTGRTVVPGLAARLSAMGVSYHFLPNVTTGLGLKMAKPCMGSTIALKRETLVEIGGFEAFADFLADDYEIGRAVRALGLQVAIPDFAVRHAATETTARDWLMHELRWMRTIRLNDPAGHVGSIVTHPTPLALLAALVSWTPLAFGALAAALIVRALLKVRIDGCFAARSGPHWLLPLRDTLVFFIFLASLVGGAVEWRGERLDVSTAGTVSKSK